MADWYPGKDADLVLFLTNFTENIDLSTKELGLPEGTFKQAANAAQEWLEAYTAREQQQRQLDAALDRLHRQATATETQVRAAAKQIKGMLNVSPQVLTLLELLPTGEPTRDRVAAQSPVLDASVELNKVLLKFKKMGHQGVRLYSRRAAETAFSVLGTYGTSPMHDDRPNAVLTQPEHRDYYAVYVDKDQPVGEVSATVTVVVGAGTL